MRDSLKQAINEAHELAIEHLDLSIQYRRRGEGLRAMVYLHRAYLLESKSAWLLAEFDLQPTRSVLFRSAAQLAVDCGLPDQARELIKEGLKNNPPKEIENELHEIFVQLE